MSLDDGVISDEPAETRQLIIFGALREVSFYLATHDALDHDIVRSVVVDEALALWMGRPLLATPEEVRTMASEVLDTVNSAKIENLLMRRGVQT